ncbi:MAG TPA: SpaH/EbpB family LPXTG-anchored major pilin [Candidatus Anaerobutyricum stercoripullorum]|uniref:SpaH/EbpB family LPXTG-anchored major pilin n=1 Tax=Candidatus Anaerobutyricum stercoripullorum TaxID=2838456 RepID=A0A9D1X613_9FIRM|nr:SpaH/EbpB family LPXTG-anchored major pilin [Candidatus Anaerobutyricum stercoripullorum]
MKHLKKLAGCLLALVMILTMSNVAVVNAANGTNNNSGTITINDAIEGHTYNAYQILVLESYNTDKGAYAYKANPDWADWLANQKQYVSIDDQGYVTWVKDADAAAFAKAALAHAEESSINPIKTVKADGTTVNFTDLNLGYYLVDTTVGTLCSLNTTTPNVIMEEKNEIPPVDKKVQEDSTGNWEEENTAEIGDTVKFKTTITAKKGAESYVLHDVMSDGLTLNGDSIKVQVNGANLATANYTIKTSGLTDDCDFEITFAQSYLDTITADTDIVVTYSAVVNENAVVYDDANTNKTKLTFGEDNRDETTWDETKTYTFKVDVAKTDGENKVLDGAQFKLYDAKTGGNEIVLVQVNQGVDGAYRLAKEGETGVEYITTKDGQLEIKGFDANTNYYLEETKAPDGYNKLAERVEIAVKEANLDATVSNNTWQSGGVHIVNNTGSLLPGTGGMGTTVLYMAGGVLVIAAGALLIFRRRMHTDR